MKLKHLYLILCVIAVILTYSQMLPFLAANNNDILVLFQQMFINQGVGFFSMDLLVLSLVALVFMIVETKRLHLKYLWLPIVAIFMVGMSLALPLFLFLRELQLEKSKI